MAVPSIYFLGFAALFVLLINLSTRKLWRDCVMLLANICFLASYSHQISAFVPLMVFIGVAYALIEAVRRWPKQAFWPAIATVLLTFFWIKKYLFVPSSVILPWPYLIIGVSYIMFRVLHLVIDSGQGQVRSRINILDYLNYTLNFTCIVAGPIQLYPDYRDGHIGRPNQGAVGIALERIVIGMFKVLIVSAALDGLRGHSIDGILGGSGTLLDLLTVVPGYAIYLYFNFSGYVDVVIGVSLLMGLRLPENFNRPFISTSFIEFWSRWHITLSTWLRTYVYSQIMMNVLRRMPSERLETFFSVFAFFVTFFLVGAWHGQTSEFLFFGLLQGGGVAANKLYQVRMAKTFGNKAYRKLGERPVYRALSRGLTFSWFAFTLIWFWGNWRLMGQIYDRVGLQSIIGGLIAMYVLATVLLDILVRGSDWSMRSGQIAAFRTSPYTRAALAGIMTFILIFTIYLLSSRPPAIVYKAF